MKRKTNNKTTTTSNHKLTFADHIEELRGRLFWVAIVFIIASAAVYPFHDSIFTVLFAPLKGQELIYLTPMGGFSFIIKICTYVGFIVAIPLLIYHLYKFLHPVMPSAAIKAKRFFMLSLTLAIIGVGFAYFVLLPTALKFLTSVDIQSVSAMLTVDAYLNFVIAYIIGSVIMFQIPVLLLLFNNITPISPKTLMKYQKYIILGAFIFAAILSPTPDAINQSLMAVPMIVMYQVAILLIIFVNRNRIAHALHIDDQDEVVAAVDTTAYVDTDISASREEQVLPVVNSPTSFSPTNTMRVKSIDGLVASTSNQLKPRSTKNHTLSRRSYVTPQMTRHHRMNTTDGFYKPVRSIY